jgi:hypothetical protein
LDAGAVLPLSLTARGDEERLLGEDPGPWSRSCSLRQHKPKLLAPPPSRGQGCSSEKEALTVHQTQAMLLNEGQGTKQTQAYLMGQRYRSRADVWLQGAMQDPAQACRISP